MPQRRYNKNEVIVLEQRLLKSRAWLSLSGAAPLVYLLFRTKCQMGERQGKPGKRRRVIANNGQIVFTYEEAREKYHITDKRFTRAIDQLVERGFLDIAATGAGQHKVETWYAISERWRQYGTPEFAEAKRRKRSAGHPGFRQGNDLWRMRRKTNSTDENICGATDENIGGEGVCGDSPQTKTSVAKKRKSCVKGEAANG